MYFIFECARPLEEEEGRRLRRRREDDDDDDELKEEKLLTSPQFSVFRTLYIAIHVVNL